MVVQRISKSRLKAKMLEIFRALEVNGGEVIVTDRDRPVLRIVPFKKRKNVKELFSEYQGMVVFTEDPNTPTTEDWEDIK